MSSHALFRRSRAVAAVAAATALTLGVAACSDDDDDSDTGTSASASAGGSDSDSDSDDAEQGTWPRTVDSLVIENGQPTGDTEEVEIPAQPEKIVSTSVTLTGTLLAVDAPVVASGGAEGSQLSDDKGFFTSGPRRLTTRAWRLSGSSSRTCRRSPPRTPTSSSSLPRARMRQRTRKSW